MALPILSPSAARRARSSARQRRWGGVTLLSAFLLVAMVALLALAIDVGMLCIAKAELQRSADAAALAATDELLCQMKARLERGGEAQDPLHVLQTARMAVSETAAQFAGVNEVGRGSPQLERNPNNQEHGDTVVGEWISTGGESTLRFSDPDRFNSVIVRVNRTARSNGEVSLFFGRFLGRDSAAASALAQAAFIQEFRGFRVPAGPGDPPPTLPFLPFAVEQSAWQSALSGAGADDYAWDRDAQKVVRGSDGIAEMSLFPLETGAGGNFGTVDIGSNNSNTPTLRRQIVEGVTRDDLEFHGGELSLNARGELHLSGDPGLKAGAIQPALQKIVGQTRIVPLYNSVSGSGNRAQFTIVGFAGGRILDVKLTGSTRYLRMQSAPMITRGGIEGRGGSSQIFSPVKLVR